MKADLFCFELFLHQLRDHGVVFRHPGQRHINILHVFGLENVLHSCRGNDAEVFAFCSSSFQLHVVMLQILPAVFLLHF